MLKNLHLSKVAVIILSAVSVLALIPILYHIEALLYISLFKLFVLLPSLNPDIFAFILLGIIIIGTLFGTYISSYNAEKSTSK